MKIIYRFFQTDKEMQEFTIELNGATALSKPMSPAPYPAWTELGYRTCDGCTLKDTDHCPVAVRLVDPLARFTNIVSFERVRVEVETEERTCTKEVAMQEGIRSMFGLLMATSGCPSLSAFRPMARYHLPFSSFDETFFRICSIYLMQKFFAGETTLGRQQIVDGLNQISEQSAAVNEGIMNRLREGYVTQADSSPNAVAILAAFSGLVPLTAEAQLNKMEKLFA